MRGEFRRSRLSRAHEQAELSGAIANTVCRIRGEGVALQSGAGTGIC